MSAVANEKIRVAFDATSLLGQRTGIGHVSAAIVERLSADPTLDLRTFAVSWRGRRELAQSVPKGVHASPRPFPARLARRTWPRFARPRAEFWTGPVDVVHAPNFVAPPTKTPVLLTIHDLTFHRFPDMCTADVLTFDAHIRRSLGAGALVHATTDFVKSEVQDVYDLPDERVVRIYTGPLPIHPGDPSSGRRLAGSERYLVSLGTIEPRKNLPRLVAAFDAIAGDRQDLALVIAGPDGWGKDEYDAAVHAARHRDRIVRLGYISYDQRADLLAGATALAYPSIYEGFGFPPLEAMGVGIPVVASDSSALPESLGDAALLPDPLDTDSIAAALARVVDDDELRATLVARGRRRASRYSWDDTATELAAVYHRLASS